jgi:serine/threonine-protein phosphatase PGAM5
VKQSTPIRVAVAIAGWLLSWSAPSVGQSANHAPAEPFARTVYLVRHGAYDASSKSDSPDGPGLLPLGIAQARLIGARLHGLPATITAITTSTMTRARETAAVMHESLPAVLVQESNLLRECTPPTHDQTTDEQTEKEQRTCQSTLDEAFMRYFTPARGSDQNDVLVCHGNVIRYLVTKALGVDPRAWTGMNIAHASLTVVRIRPNGSATILSVGDVGHLPRNFQSWGEDADRQLVVPKVSPSGR